MVCKTHLYSVFATVDGKFVQVLFVNNDHWICVAGNKNNEVSVYDSVGGNLNKIRYMLLREWLSVKMKS